jgi:hypothetical protein
MDIECPETIIGGFYGFCKPPSVEWLSHTILEIEDSFPIPYSGHRVPRDHLLEYLMVCDNHLVSNGCPKPFSTSKIISPYHILDVEFPKTIVG